MLQSCDAQISALTCLSPCTVRMVFEEKHQKAVLFTSPRYSTEKSLIEFKNSFNIIDARLILASYDMGCALITNTFA